MHLAARGKNAVVSFVVQGVKCACEVMSRVEAIRATATRTPARPHFLAVGQDENAGGRGTHLAALGNNAVVSFGVQGVKYACAVMSRVEASGATASGRGSGPRRRRHVCCSGRSHVQGCSGDFLHHDDHHRKGLQ